MSHYQVLQVSQNADTEVIEAAYKALMKLHHPDTTTTKGRTAVLLNQAYSTLRDPASRAKYDECLAATPSAIGNYKVISSLAEGGFGTTYLGKHLTLGNKVCIKHCNHISPTDTQILKEEAQAIWDLRHHGLPAVRDFLILEDDSAALVMSYIPGPTLEEIATSYAKRGEKIHPEHVAWIMERILNILSYLHRHGVVHGDIKPQNIIVQPESHTVVLIDFGLSAVKPHRGDRAKGYTDVFAPSEQMRGQTLIPEVDFFSMAVSMLYALNTGNIPQTHARSVPTETPEPMCLYLKQFLKHDPLSRPNWSTDLIKDCINMRRTSFGRGHSGMLKLRV